MGPRLIALRRRFAPQIIFVQARLSVEGDLGLRFTLAVLLFIGATWLFGGVAEDVMTGDPLVAVDARISQWLHSHASQEVTRYMLLVTNLHGTTGISVLALALAAWLLWKRERVWVLALVTVLPVGMLINIVLKEIFRRDRPAFGDPILTLTSYSFPSGHVVGTTLLYGVLAAFLASRLKTWRWQVVALFSACVPVILVAASRIYLGVHYFSDVVAAAAWSTAWLTVCLIAIDSMRRRKTRRSVGASRPYVG